MHYHTVANVKYKAWLSDGRVEVRLESLSDIAPRRGHTTTCPKVTAYLAPHVGQHQNGRTKAKTMIYKGIYSEGVCKNLVCVLYIFGQWVCTSTFSQLLLLKYI